MFLVSSGTAANALALAHLAPPWGAVLCHDEAHIATDECGAPEFYGGGIKLIGLAGEAGKIAPATLAARARAGQWGGPHHVTPAVLSLSQATEAGTIYRPDEIRELAEIAHARGLAVHVDGARLANALARMNASPAQATWKVGVDALSFGATKGGALAAEAIVFFDPARGADMAERRKRGGHLVSKHRFVAAQIDAYLADDLWLGSRGTPTPWPTGSQPDLPPRVCVRSGRSRRTRCSSRCRRRSTHGSRRRERFTIPGRRRRLPTASSLPRDAALIRLVTSFATTADEVDRLFGGACDACVSDTPAPKLRPIPGYGSTQDRYASRRRERSREPRFGESCLETEDRTLRGRCIGAQRHGIGRRSGAAGAARVSRSCPSGLRGGIAAARDRHHRALDQARAGAAGRCVKVPTYALRAIDPDGREVRVIVDARLGRILQVVPVLGAALRRPAAAYGRPPGRIPRMPMFHRPELMARR